MENAPCLLEKTTTCADGEKSTTTQNLEDKAVSSKSEGKQSIDSMERLVDDGTTPLYLRMQYAARLAGLPEYADASDMYLALLDRGRRSKYQQMRSALEAAAHASQVAFEEQEKCSTTTTSKKRARETEE